MSRRKQETGRLRRQENINTGEIAIQKKSEGETNMEGILKVTPEKLIQSSGEFADMGGQMKNLTGEMMSLISRQRLSSCQ